MRFSDDYDTEPVSKGPTVEQFSNLRRVPGRTRADLSSPKIFQALQAVQNQNSVSLSPKPIAAHRLFAPRRQHRLCHRRPVAHCLVACTANVQRLAWHKISYRPMLLHVIQKMREHKVEFMMLTEIPRAALPWWQLKIASYSRGALLVFFCPDHVFAHGNIRAANITRGNLGDGWASFSKSGELVWAFSLVMHITRVLQTRRLFVNNFSEKAKTFLTTLLVLISFWLRATSIAISQKLQMLDTPSTRRAYQMVEFMASQSLSIVDRHFACHRRGTWWNASNKKWYENDVFLTKGTIGMKSISKLKTCTMDGCDHRMKILHFCLPGRRPMWTRVAPEGKDVFIDGFGVTRMRGKIRWDVARGPSEGAEKRQERFQIETGTRWENM